METDISIRPYRLDDAAALHEAAIESVSEVRPFMPWCRPDLTVDAARCWIEAQVSAFEASQRVRLKVGGTVVGEVAVPNTGSWDSYAMLHLGELNVPRGAQDLTVEFPTGGLNLDWVFVRKASACP